MGDKSDQCPPVAVVCKLHICLYTPDLNNLGAKSAIVSDLHLKYSRFLETRARDRVRSALRGVGRSLARGFWRRSCAASAQRPPSRSRSLICHGSPFDYREIWSSSAVNAFATAS